VDWIHVAQKIPVAGSCEHGNDASGFINIGGFLTIS
jgi:hypothetical protein